MQSISRLIPYIIAMVVIVVAANILVQTQFQYFGLQEVLTWGALTYPFAFLVNDLTNRHLGSAAARKVVLIGFAIAVLLSNNAWWVPPFISTFIGSAIDTAIFFSLAFAPAFAGIDAVFGFDDGSLGVPASAFGIAMPLWASLAVGDMVVKICVGLFALIPYGGFLKATEEKAA